MTNKLLPILTIIIFFATCIEKPKDCQLNKVGILIGNYGKVIANDSIIIDIGIDTIIGGEYSFFKNGLLESYSFIVQSAKNTEKIHPDALLVKPSADSSNMIWYSTYSELYDNAGKLIRRFGQPLVYTDIHIMKDSTFIKMYFFTFNKEYTKILVTDKNHIPYKTTIQIAPLFSNMRLVSLGYKSKGEKNFVAFVRADYKDNCSSKQNVIFDTLSFDY